jgi:hypothetical protein
MRWPVYLGKKVSKSKILDLMALLLRSDRWSADHRSEMVRPVPVHVCTRTAVRRARSSTMDVHDVRCDAAASHAAARAPSRRRARRPPPLRRLRRLPTRAESQAVVARTRCCHGQRQLGRRAKAGVSLPWRYVNAGRGRGRSCRAARRIAG